MPVLAAVAVPHPPLIIPEVGRGEEKRIQHTINAYQQAMRFLALFKPDTVVLTTPHTVMYADYFHISPGKSACGDLSRFNAPQAKVEIPYDEDFARRHFRRTRSFFGPCHRGSASLLRRLSE